MTDRVCVFIDGQNVFKGVHRRYRTRLHPVLLARDLAGDRNLVATNYYSGIHDRSVNPSMNELVTRRHDLIRQTGVEVTERTLRYHWEWKITGRLPPPWSEKGPDQTKAEVKRHRSAREKGIDVALALDAVAAAFADECDVVIIVSRDRDLMEIADDINGRCDTEAVTVEVAYVSEERGDEPKLDGYEAKHRIDEAMVNRCRDDFDYRDALEPAEVQRFLDELVLDEP